jgi:hypothetical protein
MTHLPSCTDASFAFLHRQVFLVFSFLVGLVLGLRASPLHSRHFSAYLVLVILKVGVSQTALLWLPLNLSLLISASQVARITGVSHWCPARLSLF